MRYCWQFAEPLTAEPSSRVELTGRRLKKPLTACIGEIMKLLVDAGAIEGGSPCH